MVVVTLALFFAALAGGFIGYWLGPVVLRKGADDALLGMSYGLFIGATVGLVGVFFWLIRAGRQR